jgi:hypothetical protein
VIEETSTVTPKQNTRTSRIDIESHSAGFGVRIEEFSDSRFEQCIPWALAAAAHPLFELPDAHFMRSRRALHTDRQPSDCPRFHSVAPGMLAELLDGQRRRFVKRFRRHFDGVPDAVRIHERDDASPSISHPFIIANKKRNFLERISWRPALPFREAQAPDPFSPPVPLSDTGRDA